MVLTDEKIILDACCGSRMMWFDKENPNTIYSDIRDEEHELCDGRRLEVHPDITADFRDMPWPDNSFKLVVFDPPHMKRLGRSSWMAKKYGVLNYHWRDDICQGLTECLRVLEPHGILIFKWNASQIPFNEIMKLLPQQPLFGHTSGKGGLTTWMVFMKIENLK